MKMVKCPQAVPFFGTSRKGSQSPKGGLVSACLISVSVLSFLFCFCLVSFGLSGRGSGERNSEAKSPPQGGGTPLFIEGECLGF